ncbi:hypothetical protein NQZ68_020397 [Dissostichus eleginoides]|nr:hypothetical protein NQZ68_020397 [Dissostichus eleginoides]
MAPEQRSNAAGPDTETSVQKGRPRQTNDPDIVPPPPLNPPIFPGLRQRTCDDRGFSTGHGDPLLPFCSHWPLESIHSSPFSVPINLLSMFPGSTFLPIKSFHCQALQESGYTGL